MEKLQRICMCMKKIVFCPSERSTVYSLKNWSIPEERSIFSAYQNRQSCLYGSYPRVPCCSSFRICLRNNKELHQLLAGTTIAYGGVLGYIYGKNEKWSYEQQSWQSEKETYLPVHKSKTTFPCWKNWRYLKKGWYSQGVRTGHPLYMDVVIEYRDAEKRIIPRHVLLAVRSGEERHKLLAGVTIAHGRKTFQKFRTSSVI
ncbi:hypothetical protein M9H77_29756 [Catharanthus roseus]|uniref:Uncharacterized protein n=1 Tax=Catharanthus roseus TaxID=4058 RepID=A0ACB9ZVP3_CATRO|nr:hypothetical protein M9H77_29756 [Catharanthus roseus]